jgi:hypothetical protein
MSTGTDFWPCVDWDLFCHLSEYYSPLKPVTPFELLVLYFDLFISIICVQSLMWLRSSLRKNEIKSKGENDQCPHKA